MEIIRNESDETRDLKAEFIKSEVRAMAVDVERTGFVAESRTHNAGLEIGCLVVEKKFDEAIDLFFCMLRGEK